MTDKRSAAEEPIGRPQALRIIESLRAGTDCLEGVSIFSAGRRELLAAAADQLDELQISGGASVRWVRGRTGQGKTHLFARLIDSAHTRNWVTSYVQVSERGYGVEMHRFEEVYAAIVRNCLCRDLVAAESGRIEPGRVPGWDWILQNWWNGVQRLVVRRDQADVPTLRLYEALGQTITSMRRRWNVHHAFAEALHQYGRAEMDGDAAWSAVLRDWFHGVDVHAQGGEIRARLRDAGINESVNRRNAREMLRSLSAFLQSRGYGGMLILIDELENILHQTASARRTAWTILRELIDNIDDRHGMAHTAFYVAATPDVFDSPKGMNEYPALAERVQLAGTRSVPNPAASVIDLAAWPLQPDDLAFVGNRIAVLHGIARNWAVTGDVERNLEGLLKATLQRDRDLTARTWVKGVVDRLDQLRAAERT